MKKLLFVLMSAVAFWGWSTVSAQGTYTQITSASGLEENGVYLIASAEYGTALALNFGNNTAREAAKVTVTNGVISAEVATKPTDKLPYEIKLEKKGSNWALYDMVNQQYIARTTDDANTIQLQSEPYEWKITIDADGNADIASLESTVRRILYNSNSGQERFSGYRAVNTNIKAVQLYKSGGTYVDETAPKISSVVAKSATSVEVLFNEALDKASAETVGNYTINNDISVSAAALGEDNKTVTLTTSALTGGVTNELVVNGVKDLAGNATENLKYEFAYGYMEVEDLAELCAMRETYAKGQKYLVKGEVVVTAIIGKFGSNQTTTNAWVQDKDCETSKGHSMMLYYVNDIFEGVKVGDVITGIVGELTVYSDLIEMQNLGSSTIEVTGTADITVDDVTIADLNGADKWLYQNAIVRIKNAQYADAGKTFAENTNYSIRDDNNGIMPLRTNREGDYLGQTIPSGKVTVSGYVGYYSGNVQLCVRTKEDCGIGVTPDPDPDPSAIEDLANINFSVYPNPTNGMLNVELNDGGLFDLFVYNVNGMQLLRHEGLMNNARVDLSALAKGMYVVEIRTAEGVVRTKVVVR